MIKYLLIFLIFFSANAFSALTKWVDANGQVHYSDVPPPPSANIKILSKTQSTSDDSQNTSNSAASSVPAAPDNISEREAEIKKTQQAKKEAADKAAKQQADAEAKKNYCDTLQQNLKVLQDDVRIMALDASGNRSFLEDEQRQQRIAKAQQDINTHCK